MRLFCGVLSTVLKSERLFFVTRIENNFSISCGLCDVSAATAAAAAAAAAAVAAAAAADVKCGAKVASKPGVGAG